MVGIYINFVRIFVVDLLGMEAIDESWVETFKVWPVWFYLFIYLN